MVFIEVTFWEEVGWINDNLYEFLIKRLKSVLSGRFPSGLRHSRQKRSQYISDRRKAMCRETAQ